MIEINIIFGKAAVRRYCEKKKVPSESWMRRNSCVIEHRAFKTFAEYIAYVQGLHDADGWEESYILPPHKTIESECPHCNRWREFFKDNDGLVYCPGCGNLFKTPAINFIAER